MTITPVKLSAKRCQTFHQQAQARTTFDNQERSESKSKENKRKNTLVKASKKQEFISANAPHQRV